MSRTRVGLGLAKPQAAALALGVAVSFGLVVGAAGAEVEAMGRTTVNSLGMKLVRIPGGVFVMGSSSGGDHDERPTRRVRIGRALWMGTTEVTNAQYERFDPKHRALRGRRGLSKADDEPVAYVTWHDAVRFCEWLTKKEGRPYRLPTEAEWEYACRADTTTKYHTGERLPKAHHRHQKADWHPHAVSLIVGETRANAWGLHEMHGGVEEWCADWYAPYEADEQIDPVGPAEGVFKVTRGGSHNTDPAHLRSANRLGTLPEDRHWLIGFRVVQAPPPKTKPSPPPAPKPWARDVKAGRFDWSGGPAADRPLFAEPVRYVRRPRRVGNVPMYPHNHCPSIAWCDNGDLLAIWFSTRHERGREMTILASRLRAAAKQWDGPSEFFKAPDRNMTGSSLLNDGSGRLLHLNGLEAAGCWANLALVMRTSRDCGATWSRPRLINAEHQPRNQVISGASVTKEGWLIQPCDAVHGGRGGTAIHVSRDGGKTWADPGASMPKPDFQSSKEGATIAGIHAGVVQLKDGSLLAYGRGDNRLGSNDNIGQRMPVSRSRDMGKSWSYAASEFPPIDGGQRLVLMRLREGPLLLVSFTDSSRNLKKPTGMVMGDGNGKRARCFGAFAALSSDEGKSWPVRRILATGGPARTLDGGAWTRQFTMDATHAEPKGYFAATQTPDGVIHLISSALHYRFNLAWLKCEQMSTAR